MFARLSVIPPYYDERSEAIFGNIGGSSFDNDNTMVATLRSLLYPRLKKDEVFNFDYTGARPSSLNGFTSSNIFNYYGVPHPNQIFFIGIDGSTDDIKALFDKLDDNAVKEMQATFPDFEEKKDISAYYQAKFDIAARFYIVPSINSCIAFFDQNEMTARVFHTLVALIPRFIPTLFKENPITEQEAEVFRCLGKTKPDGNKLYTAEDYLAAIKVLSESIDFRTLMINKMLNGFEKRMKQAQLDSANADLQACEDKLDSYTRKYSELLHQREDIVIKIEGLSALMRKIDDGSDIVNYFKEYKNIDLVKVENSKIHFIVRTYLDQFDAEAYNTYKHDNYFYEHMLINNRTFKDVENRKLLLDNIFSEDPLLRIKVCAYFAIDTYGSVNSCRGYIFPSECNDYIPNPHLHRHNCIGNNQALIQEQLRNGDTIGAIACCQASAMNVNVVELQATFRPFCENLLSSDRKIITNKDGVDMTPVEALAWLKSRNQGEQQ